MIFKARSNLTAPSLAQLKKLLMRYREVENHIVIKRNKSSWHLVKWDVLDRLYYMYANQTVQTMEFIQFYG